MSACKVVLIEDNPADVFLIQLALKENDVACELTLFNTGEEALKVLCPPEGGGPSPLYGPATAHRTIEANIPKTI